MFFMFPPRYKKSVETYQLLAPLVEAVGLPITVETSNHDPTPICIEPIATYIRLKIREMYKQSADYIPMGVYRCCVRDSNLRVSYASNESRTKRVIYAFSIYGVPQRQRNAFLQLFPAVLNRFRREDDTKIQKFLNSPNPQQVFFQKNVWITPFIVQISKNRKCKNVRRAVSFPKQLTVY